jgi:hypothetical protein
MLMKIMNQFNIKREMAFFKLYKIYNLHYRHRWHGGHFNLEKEELQD